MIAGLGVDLCDKRRVSRFAERRGTRLYRRILSDNELLELDMLVNKSDFLARRIAAKEAIAKALGTGIAKGVGWHNIEVGHMSNGRPVAVLSGVAKRLLKESGSKQTVHLSITDEHDYAAAVAVIETSDQAI